MSDCPELRENFGDKCITPNGQIGFVNKDCKCEPRVNDGKFDCPELQLNIGDKCKTKDGKVGIVNRECECEASTDVNR